MTRNWLLWASCALMLLAGGYWLWMSGNQNILSYAILLLCPLMHLLMHSGHGAHNKKHGSESRSASPKPVPGEDKRPACH